MSILKCNCNQKMLTLTHYSQDFKNIKEYELNQLNMLTAYCTFTALYLAHKSQFLSFKWNFTSVVISYFAWEIWSCLGKASAISILSVLLMWMFCSIFVGFFLTFSTVFLLSNLWANFNTLCCLMWGFFLFHICLFSIFALWDFFYSLIFICYLTHNALQSKTLALSFPRRDWGWENFLNWKKIIIHQRCSIIS